MSVALLVACSSGSDTPRIPVAPCVVTSTLSGNTFAPAGGVATATVSTRQGCTWSVTADAWIAPSVTSGDGAATISLKAAPNDAGTARAGSVRIADTVHAVTQPGCSVSLSTADEQFSERGETRTVTILGSGACRWEAVTTADWIAVEPKTGASPGQIRVAVAENNTGSPRVAAVDVNGVRATIRQAAEAVCRYEVRPAEVLAMPLPESGEIAIDTAPGCGWQATATEPWLTIASPASGSGPGVIRYSVPLAHSGASSIQERRAAVEVRGDATAGPNVWIRQLPTCAMVFLEPPGTRAITSTQVHSGGGSYSVWTLADPAFSCPWTARSDVSWISVTFPAYPTIYRGDGTVSFVAEPNPTSQERRGRIMAGEKFLVVIQPGR